MSHLGPEQLIGMQSADPQVRDFLLGMGENAEVDRFAEMDLLDFPHNGVALYFDKNKHVVTIFLHGTDHEGHDKYRGPFPHGLTFGRSRPAVLQLLGQPNATGKERAAGAPWDRFDFDRYSVHLKYSPDSTAIQMITIMSPEMAKGEI